MDEKTIDAERLALQKMTESEGWHIFVRNTQAQLDHLRTNGWSTIKSMDQLWYAKGCMDTMHACVNFDKLLEAAQQQPLDYEGEAP